MRDIGSVIQGRHLTTLVIYSFPLLRSGVRSVLEEHYGSDMCVLDAANLRRATLLLRERGDPPVDLVMCGPRVRNCGTDAAGLRRMCPDAVFCLLRDGGPDDAASLVRHMDAKGCIDPGMSEDELVAEVGRLLGVESRGIDVARA